MRVTLGVQKALGGSPEGQGGLSVEVMPQPTSEGYAGVGTVAGE